MGILDKILGKPSVRERRAKDNIVERPKPSKEYQEWNSLNETEKYCKYLKRDVKIIDMDDLFYHACIEGLPLQDSECENNYCFYHNVMKIALMMKGFSGDDMLSAQGVLGAIDFTKSR